MKRVCTKYENSILRECAADILARPEICRTKFRSRMIPMVLGAFAGLGICALIMSGLSITSKIGLQVALGISAMLMVEVFVFVWEWFSFRKKRNKYLPGEKYWINSGTVLKYLETSSNKACLYFVEDGITDEDRNPCVIVYPVLNDLDFVCGERILLVYSDNGAYMPMKVTQRTEIFMPGRKPTYIDEIDWNKATKLPHPLVVELDKESHLMNDKDAAAFAKNISKNGRIRAANYTGVIMVGVLALILLGLLFIGLVAAEIIIEIPEAIAVAAVMGLIWLFLIYVSARFLLSGRVRGLKKIRYKKKVMFHSVYDTYENRYYEKYIFVYEYVNNKLELVPYPVNMNVFISKDIPYGSIIHKYSKDKVSCAADLNYFTK